MGEYAEQNDIIRDTGDAIDGTTGGDERRGVCRCGEAHLRAHHCEQRKGPQADMLQENDRPHHEE